jgi:virginiamycin B lyase
MADKNIFRKSATSIVVISVIGLCLAGTFIRPVMGAEITAITGAVKDDSGKPVRGARITATSGYKSVSRFSDAAGRYKITGLKPGTYAFSAGAWGFEEKKTDKELSADAEMNFTLAPHWDVRKISTADWLTALPENEETQELRATCIKCHNLSWMVRNKGLQSQGWYNDVIKMGDFGDRLYGKFDPKADRNRIRITEDQAQKVTAILTKYFGPNAPLPTREQVTHPRLSDAALRATFREYKVPTKSYIHTIHPDRNGKYVWFTEFDNYSKRMGRFDIASEEFLEVSLPAPGSTFTVAKDGKVWVTARKKMYEIDAESGKVTEHDLAAGNVQEDAGEGGGRPMANDSAGNVWLSGGRQVSKFDPRSGTLASFPLPKVTAIPEDYYRNIQNTKADGQKEFDYGTYALTVDSRDNIWFTAYDVGQIGRLDPRTKDVKMYRIPGALWIKGIMVDRNDMVWFGNFLHGTLGKLDPKTGQVEYFRPPTRFASFYTPVEDKKGNIWLSDFAGSQMTRFNPRTKEFTEYPLPAPDGMVRFFGLDPKDRVWYVDFDTGRIGVLDPGDSATP